ncbi:MAG: ATP-binding cassette domain-containing protein [Pseudomonadota bacterium]
MSDETRNGSAPALECAGVCKSYQEASQRLDVLVEVDFVLERGDKVGVVGASGSGKSTLLNLLAGLDQVSAGAVTLAGRNLKEMSEKERARWRNQHLGFVYQFHHLLAEFSAQENVAMPMLIAGQSRRSSFAEADNLLRAVGLGDRRTHRPGQLSGGERQRVAIARSLINRPSCVLMDEPTGNLDPDNAGQVLQLIDELREKSSSAFLIVTHDQTVADHMHRVLRLESGGLHVGAGAHAH